ncbi:YggS family pyridoxal phosphate-dependent enzyme [uncultured Ezakiella sp.]|uniref:YggS family pyridoxal phosphate-dependent enzyme n=1 Tax=uncultured Ezakiella sp. TaxID=1637529 RepID=UPI0025FC3925|nr:YggS family pyridoxal phosphate-dependent enzyme [uncultured Ezakiella sp.]
MIKENLNLVNEKIKIAAEKSGRTFEDISLVAVTKTHGMDMIDEAIDAGVLNIGENRVQELMTKIEYIPENVNIHMIGQLQSNKVKYIIDRVNLIQSLDRMSLLKKIQAEAEKIDKIQDCLIQINLTDDKNRAGVHFDDLENFCKEVSKCKNVRVLGLMCVAPLDADENELIKVFSDMRLAFEGLKCYNIDNVCPQILSMGMSSDFELAIEQGANMVRVGSAIFGHR